MLESLASNLGFVVASIPPPTHPPYTYSKMADDTVFLPNDNQAASLSAFEPTPNNNDPEKDAQNGAPDLIQNGGTVSNGHSYPLDANQIVNASLDINGMVVDSQGEPDAAPCEAFKPESLPKEPQGISNRVPSPSQIPPPSPHEKSSPRRSPSPRKGTPTKIPSLKQRPKSVGSYEETVKPRSPKGKTSPRPNSCVIKSDTARIDSQQDNYTTSGGNVKILESKVNMSGVKPRTVTHTSHKPGGGNVKIFDQKVDYSHVKARSDVGSGKSSPRRSTSSEPTSPRVKTAPTTLPNTKSVQSKIGSKDNLKHTPGGGKVKIQTEKVDFSTVQSRCGSMDNSKHRPGGGNVKKQADCDRNKKTTFVIYMTLVKRDRQNKSPTPTPPLAEVDGRKTKSAGPGPKKLQRPYKKLVSERLDFDKRARSKVGSLDNVRHSPGGGTVKIESKKLDFSKTTSKIGSKDNIKHQPQGGNKKIVNEKLEFKAESKIGSKDNIKHQAGGGNVKITTEKVDFSAKASSKIGSKDNMDHKPGGGHVKIVDEKLVFKETAAPKTDTGAKEPRSPGAGSQSRSSRGSRASEGSQEGVSVE
ncbi:microtubule-associated protein tau-like isoform X6 [Patiria miniata]|uniref:Microtubule-associated protein n=1 Tax=Patiria miniata TaxID=46514 RepID=A0A914BTT3_PATMI|nr:microtubule-associated protein tau-like isoform X6 [Patiria miniata]